MYAGLSLCKFLKLLRWVTSSLYDFYVDYSPPPTHPHTHTHAHCTHGTCGVLHCLLFCDQTRPNLRISLVGYHCSIEFPCGVPLFYCCKYPTTYGVRVHTRVDAVLCGLSIVLSFVLLLPNPPWLCARKCYRDIKMSPQLRCSHTLTQLWGHPCPHNSATARAHTQTCQHRQTGSSHCSSFVYTLTFSQHLSYVLYTFGKRGPFSNWGPYCSFCYKSPVWMPKQTHTHALHMALMGNMIVFCFVTKCGQTIEFLLWGTIVPLNFLVGYHCSIVASTPQPMAYAFTRMYEAMLDSGGLRTHDYLLTSADVLTSLPQILSMIKVCVFPFDS